MEPKIIQPKESHWMHRLRAGHIVWLPKERLYAQVAFRWERPGPGHVSGNLVLRRIHGNPFTKEPFDFLDCNMGPIEMWYVKPDGTGFDGKPLVLPLEGHFPKEVLPYDEDRIEKLENDVLDLKNIILNRGKRRPTVWDAEATVVPDTQPFLTYKERHQRE